MAVLPFQLSSYFLRKVKICVLHEQKRRWPVVYRRGALSLAVATEYGNINMDYTCSTTGEPIAQFYYMVRFSLHELSVRGILSRTMV